MEKANTANGFSVKQMAISTANVFAPTQPGQPLYGLVASSPPSAELANGDANQFGKPSDHMVGKRVGGIIVFGGGLALYSDTDVVGGLGVSGDSSCADHNVPGACARRSLSTRCRPASTRTARTRSSTTSAPMEEVPPAGATRSAPARKPTSRTSSGPASAELR